MGEKMTDDELRKLLDEATPGPLEARLGMVRRVVTRTSDVGFATLTTTAQPVAECLHGEGFPVERGEANARLFAAAPDLARDLLATRAALAAAEAERDRRITPESAQNMLDMAEPLMAEAWRGQELAIMRLEAELATARKLIAVLEGEQARAEAAEAALAEAEAERDRLRKQKNAAETTLNTFRQSHERNRAARLAAEAALAERDATVAALVGDLERIVHDYETTSEDDWPGGYEEELSSYWGRARAAIARAKGGEA